MRRATAVIGAAFGDEGKGLMTDFFTRKAGEEPWVVRFNGGAQAGHTVVTPDGDRHVFHHYGAGTLAGARTFLSRHFLVNPVLWRMEHQELQGRGMRTRLFVDREAPLTTIFDMMENQWAESDRGRDRHGSCGVGIHATMVRQMRPELRLFAGDLERPDYLRQRVEKIYQTSYLRSRPPMNYILDRFLADCALMASHINLRDSRVLLDRPGEIIFEGAQGLLLDQDHPQFFPHVTHSKTGLTNVLQLASEIGVQQIDAVYVARSYLTRHGAGPLPGEDKNLEYRDDTNVTNEWQGPLRFAPMNIELVEAAINRDLIRARQRGDINVTPLLGVTHCDQEEWKFQRWAHFKSYGRTHKDVEVRFSR